MSSAFASLTELPGGSRSRQRGREFVSVAERMLNDLRISVRSMREIGEQQRG